MKPLKSLVLLVPIVFLLGAAVACSDSEGTPSPTTTATLPPAATATPNPPTPTTPPGSNGTATGISELDSLISAVLAGDATTLTGRIALTAAPCTTAQGLGGPPKCSQAPGSPPDGTTVQAFPATSCELGWTFDPAPLATEFARRDLELFAVLLLDLPAPLFNEPWMPTLDYAILFESPSPAGDIGHLVGVTDGNVVYLESLCGGTVDTYLTDRQQISDHHEVILEGPAYR